MVTRPAALWVALALLIPEAWGLLSSGGLQPLRASHLVRAFEIMTTLILMFKEASRSLFA